MQSWLGQHREERRPPVQPHARTARAELRRLRLYRILPARHVPLRARAEPRAATSRFSRSGFAPWNRPTPFSPCGSRSSNWTSWSRTASPQADFERTRSFLSKYVNILTKTKSAELGYAIDSAYYGIPELQRIRQRPRSRKLTVEDVNRAIRKHLRADRLQIVGVAKDTEAIEGRADRRCAQRRFTTTPRSLRMFWTRTRSSRSGL